MRLRRHAFQIITRLSQQFVKDALGCLDHTLVCFTRDIAILKTTGQCTSAVVKVPESLCQFVEDFTIQVRPNRRSCGTCRLAFRSLQKVIISIERVLDWSCRTFLHAPIVIVSNDLPEDRAREHVVNTQLGHGRSVSEKF